MIDLRSDTVTKPTPAMRQAMAQADVGDDVIDQDPTIERLQERVAELLGKEAAIFMPSGTMTNQVGIRLHCGPGDEFLCEADCHIYQYEQAGFAQLSGVASRTVMGQQGVLRVEQLVDLIRPDNEHFVRTRLVALENTHNRGSGKVQPIELVQQICSWASEHGLRRHLDGARLFNAVIASGIPADRWASQFETVSVCFSKGLGAPVGSALAGSKPLMQQARRHRKVLGGGMRQAGIIAAGALYALENHVERLAEDHQNARLIGEAVQQSRSLQLLGQVDTNIVVAVIDRAAGTAAELVKQLDQAGVQILAVAPQRIRMVTHLDVSRDDCQHVAEILAEL